MAKNHLRFVLVVVAIFFILIFFNFDLQHYFTFSYLKQSHQELASFYLNHPTRTLFYYFLSCALLTTACLPGTTILTIAGGAIFGFWNGVLLALLGCTLGSTISFLGARFLFRESLQNLWSDRIQAINDGLQKDGVLYLLGLRIIPGVPFFILNLFIGVTSLSTVTFIWMTLVGMLPTTIVYANAGKQLAQLDSSQGILTPPVLLALVLIAVLPIATKKILDQIRWRSRTEGPTS